MHTTATGEKIKELRAEAARAAREAVTLAKVRGLEEGVMEKEEEARQLRGEAENLKPKARLEDLSVYTVKKEKPTVKGEARTYKYWYASWWEGDRARNVYLGSVAKLSEEAALEKARKMKADALGLVL
jgi:regulator of replication initiation timing